MSVSADGKRKCLDQRKTLWWTDQWWMELCESRYQLALMRFTTEYTNVTHTTRVSLSHKHTTNVINILIRATHVTMQSAMMSPCVSVGACLPVSRWGRMSVRWGRWRLVWWSIERFKTSTHSDQRDNSLALYTACDADHLFTSTEIKLLFKQVGTFTDTFKKWLFFALHN